jgi:molybdenum cofactor guanylyltransferase
VIERADVTGIVLCGGEATRMGGIDKPLSLLDGTALVAHILARLAPQVRGVMISANRSIDAYRALGATVVSDRTPGLGPLGGLRSALALVTTPWFFCCPGDAPRVDTAIVARLATATDGDLRIPFDGERQQHLFVLGRTSVHADLDAYLAAGGRSVHGFSAGQSLALVDVRDIAASFANVNTLAELELLEHRVRTER